MDEEIPLDAAALIAELNRVYGGASVDRFLLLPFQTMEETTAFLRTVPDGAGEAGIRATLGHPDDLRSTLDGELPPLTDDSA